MLQPVAASLSLSSDDQATPSVAEAVEECTSTFAWWQVLVVILFAGLVAAALHVAELQAVFPSALCIANASASAAKHAADACATAGSRVADAWRTAGSRAADACAAVVSRTADAYTRAQAAVQSWFGRGAREAGGAGGADAVGAADGQTAESDKGSGAGNGASRLFASLFWPGADKAVVNGGDEEEKSADNIDVTKTLV